MPLQKCRQASTRGSNPAFPYHSRITRSLKCTHGSSFCSSMASPEDKYRLSIYIPEGRSFRMEILKPSSNSSAGSSSATAEPLCTTLRFMLMMTKERSFARWPNNVPDMLLLSSMLTWTVSPWWWPSRYEVFFSTMAVPSLPIQHPAQARTRNGIRMNAKNLKFTRTILPWLYSPPTWGIWSICNAQVRLTKSLVQVIAGGSGRNETPESNFRTHLPQLTSEEKSVES